MSAKVYFETNKLFCYRDDCCFSFSADYSPLMIQIEVDNTSYYIGKKKLRLYAFNLDIHLFYNGFSISIPLWREL